MLKTYWRNILYLTVGVIIGFSIGAILVGSFLTTDYFIKVLWGTIGYLISCFTFGKYLYEDLNQTTGEK